MKLRRREELIRKELKERQDEERKNLIRKQMGEYGPVIFDWIARCVRSRAGREIISLDDNELMLYHENESSCILDKSGTLHIISHCKYSCGGTHGAGLELKCSKDLLDQLNYHNVYEFLYRAIRDGSILYIIRERFSPREERTTGYGIKNYQRATRVGDKHE